MKDMILRYALKNAVTHDGKAVAGAVASKAIGENPSLKEDIKGLMKAVAQVIKEVNAMSQDEQLRILKEQYPEMLEEEKKEKQGLPELEGVVKEVVMRLAPYPSGDIHIGNTRVMIINDEYVKKYSGKLLLVIDDTIGSEEKPIAEEAYKLIPESIKWLGIKFDKKIIYKSDRLSLFYKYGEQLIKKGAAYVAPDSWFSIIGFISRSDSVHTLRCTLYSQ